MSILRSIGCKVGWHSWEPLASDMTGEAHHKCLYCGKVKSVDTGHPPDAHDKSQINR
jgi:hypothetical protein